MNSISKFLWLPAKLGSPHCCHCSPSHFVPHSMTFDFCSCKSPKNGIPSSTALPSGIPSGIPHTLIANVVKALASCCFKKLFEGWDERRHINLYPSVQAWYGFHWIPLDSIGLVDYGPIPIELESMGRTLSWTPGSHSSHSIPIFASEKIPRLWSQNHHHDHGHLKVPASNFSPLAASTAAARVWRLSWEDTCESGIPSDWRPRMNPSRATTKQGG